MAGLGLTDYAEAKALDYFLRGTAYAQPATVYLAFFTTTPNDDGTGGVELVGDGYGRQAVAFGSYVSRRIANSGTVTFTSTGNAWPQAISCGIYDTSTSGNLMAVGTLSPQPTVGAGQSYSFVAGEILIQLDFFGPFLAQKILDKLFRNTSSAALNGSIYAALMTAATDNDGAGGAELSSVTHSDYSRKSTAWNAYASGASQMTSDVTFVASAATAYGTIQHPAYYDASTSGNFLWRGSFGSAPTYGVGALVGLRAAGCSVRIE